MTHFPYRALPEVGGTRRLLNASKELPCLSVCDASKIKKIMNNMFKSSDLLKELAPSQGEGCHFYYFDHMDEKVSSILNWTAPVAGKFGHLQAYLKKATFTSVQLLDSCAVSLPRRGASSVYFLLPSWEDFRALALAEYVDSLPLHRGLWGKIARYLRSDYRFGYHAFVTKQILRDALAGFEMSPALSDVVDSLSVDIGQDLSHANAVVIGRSGLSRYPSIASFSVLMAFDIDPDLTHARFCYFARYYTFLPFGPLMADLEHVFRTNSVASPND